MSENQEVTSTLAELGGKDQGDLVLINVRKKGVERGKNGNRQVYDNDLVQVLIWTAFQYPALVERSYKKLHQMWKESNGFLSELAEAVQQAGFADVTIQDASEAVQELSNSLQSVLSGATSFDDDTPTESSESIWTPLKVDGKLVRGAKIYSGKGDPDNPRAPIPGHIYIDGVKLGELVIEEAPHWKPERRKPKSVAKDILRSRLPVGLYVRYCLGPECLQSIKVGQEAGAAAKANGVHVETDAIRSLFKIAP